MELDGNVTMLFSENGLEMTIVDETSRSTLAIIKLNSKQVCAAMARNARIPCKMEVLNLDKVGKKKLLETYRLQVSEEDYYNKAKCEELLKGACPDGWLMSTYLGSQSSFVREDGEYFVQTHIYKWVDISET